MAERLTPYLRRRVLGLPLADRMALLEELRGTMLERPDPAIRLAYLVNKMQEAAGLDPLARKRDRPAVTARYILAFVARREGFSQTLIGTTMGLDHSSISYAEKRTREMFDYPEMYKDEISLYNKFVESL